MTLGGEFTQGERMTDAEYRDAVHDMLEKLSSVMVDAPDGVVLGAVTVIIAETLVGAEDKSASTAVIAGIRRVLCRVEEILVQRDH